MVTSTGIKGGVAGVQNLQSVEVKEAVRILRDLETQLTNGNGTKSGILRLMNASDTGGNERKTMTFERKSSWQGKRFSDPAARERTANAVRGLFLQAGLPTEALDKYLSTHQNAMGGREFHLLLRTHVEALHGTAGAREFLTEKSAEATRLWEKYASKDKYWLAKDEAEQFLRRVNDHMGLINFSLERRPGSGWETLKGQARPSELRALAQLREPAQRIIAIANKKIDEAWVKSSKDTIEDLKKRFNALEGDTHKGKTDFQTSMSRVQDIVRSLRFFADSEDAHRLLPDAPWKGTLTRATRMLGALDYLWEGLQTEPKGREKFLDLLIEGKDAPPADRIRNLEEQFHKLMEQRSQQVLQAFNARPPLNATQYAEVQIAVTALSTQIETLEYELTTLINARRNAIENAVEDAKRRIGCPVSSDMKPDMASGMMKQGYGAKQPDPPNIAILDVANAIDEIANVRLQVLKLATMRADKAIETMAWLPDWPNMERLQAIVSNGSQAAQAGTLASGLDIVSSLALDLALAVQPPLTSEQLAEFALCLHPGEGDATRKNLRQFVEAYARAVQKKGSPQEQGYPALQLARHIAAKQRPTQKVPLLQSMAKALDDSYEKGGGPIALRGRKAQGQIVVFDLDDKDDASQAKFKDCLLVFDFDFPIYRKKRLELKDMTAEGCEFVLAAPGNNRRDRDAAVAAALAGARSALNAPELAGWLADQAILMTAARPDPNLSPESAKLLLEAVTQIPSIAKQEVVAGFIEKTGGLWSLLSQADMQPDIKETFAKTLLLQHPTDRRDELWKDGKFIRILAKMPGLATDFPWLIDGFAGRLDATAHVYAEFLAEYGDADLKAAAPGRAQEVPLVPEDGGLRANRAAQSIVGKAREALDAMRAHEQQCAVQHQSAWQNSAPLREAFERDWRAYEEASQPIPSSALNEAEFSTWLEQQLAQGPQRRRPALEQLVKSSMAVAEPLTMMNNARKTLLTQLQGLNARLESITQEEQAIKDSPNPADKAGQQDRARTLSALRHERDLLEEYLPQLEQALAQVQPSPEQMAFEKQVQKVVETVADLETSEVLEALQAQARKALEGVNA